MSEEMRAFMRVLPTRTCDRFHISLSISALNTDNTEVIHCSFFLERREIQISSLQIASRLNSPSGGQSGPQYRIQIVTASVKP